VSAKSTARSAINGARTALGIGGLLAIIVGILILLWPSKTAEVMAAIIAVYVIVAGLIYAGLGIFSKARGRWSRIGHIFLGIAFVVAGIVAFANLGATTVVLALLIGVVVGLLWIVEGIMALTTLRQATSRPWTIAFAVISIIAGVVLLFAPVWGTFTLWWIVGIALTALGILQVIRAFSFRSRVS
jgi:uncharacterized membrane protein HdeD (DUF308 family)